MSAICFNLDQFKTLSSGNGLKEVKMFPVFNHPAVTVSHCYSTMNTANWPTHVNYTLMKHSL